MGEITRLIIGRITDCNVKCHTSHVMKYSIEKSRKKVNTMDFKTIDKNFYNNKRKRKLPKSYGSNAIPKSNVEHPSEIYST